MSEYPFDDSTNKLECTPESLLAWLRDADFSAGDGAARGSDSSGGAGQQTEPLLGVLLSSIAISVVLLAACLAAIAKFG